MRVVTIATAAAMTLNLVCGPMNVLASENPNESVAMTAVDGGVQNNISASVRKFELYGKDILNAYNEVFKMSNKNIESIKNNGGNYSNSTIEKAIDDNMNTHWETGRPNSATFTNEIVFNFNETTLLNRIVYAARQSSVKGKGFAQEFEIYSSPTESGDNFTLVTSGDYKGSTGDIIEIQFTPTKFKRVKFVFTKANQDWASASEFQFYKEDRLSEKMKSLFTDETLSTVSEAFNTAELINKLDTEAQEHPLYPQFKKDIENAKALINEAEIESSTAITKPFTYYANDAYSKLFRMDNKNIESISNNGGHYASAVIRNAIDENLSTYWETNTSNSNNFTSEVVVEFKAPTELNRIMYGARSSDLKGFAEEFEIYASQTSKGDTYQLVTTGQHKMVAGLVEAKFEPTQFKRVKFKFKKSDRNWATLSELAFYSEDTLEEKINNLFTNGLLNELKPEFSSISVINKLEAEVAKHPLKEQLQVNINIAKEVLSDVNASTDAIVTASQRGDSSKEASEHQVARTSLSLDTLGRYIVPGETIKVFVDADEKGVMPNLVLGQIADDKNGWLRRYSLQPGLNTITAPTSENMKPAVAYVENGALPSEQAYAPKIRLVGGTAFPVYYHGKTDPAEYEKELEKYVAKISINDNDFANGKPEDVLYNVTELISENNTISTSAAGALKGIQELKPTGKTVSDTMDEWEIMWKEFQKVSGYVENDPDPRNQFFNAKFTSRVFTKGPYGWSDWGYTGYNGGNSPKRDEGFFKQIVKPFSVPGNDGWAYYHEWGHNINNSKMEHTEVTNNIFSVIMRKIFNNSNDDRVDWNSLYKRFSGETVNHGFWTYLGILEQVQYYYGEDSYGKASRISRTNPNGVMDGLESNLQRLVVGFSLATETDLTAFFEDWGYVTATDKMKEKVAHLLKPNVKLEYMNSLGRNYEGTGFSKDAKVNVHSITTDSVKNEIKLSYDIDEANKEVAMGYEILRNGKVVGYTTESSFIDKKVEANASYIYEIVAYDKNLNKLKPVEVNSQQPNLSVEEHVTLKLHQEYDPMNYVKALSYLGENITDSVVTKSNNVDVTKKGNYEIVYEINHNGVQEVKTAKVTVTSDYTYISDRTAKSVSVGWGTLQKDKSISGETITLLRQGLNATYSKGIGAHANSEVVYDIEGEGFNFFESYIGIDQAVKGEKSSATFEVWVDGERSFDSQVFKANTDHEFVRVPVEGAKEVKLITTDARDNGNSSDHTIWADAKFTLDSSSPTLEIPKSTATKVGEVIDIHADYSAIDAEDGDLTSKVEITGGDLVNFDRVGKYEMTYSVTDSDNNTTTAKRTISVVDMDDFSYVTDFDWQSTQNSYSAPVKNQSTSHNALRLTAQDGSEITYQKGIGAHSNSTITYDLTDKNADYFTSFVGVDRQMHGSIGSVTFQVFVDGEKQYDSGLMYSKDPQKFVEVITSGAKELKLVVTDGGNGNGSDHATWGDTKFHFANSDRIFTQGLATAIEDAKAINVEEYTSDSVEILYASITSAEALIANVQATQMDIDQAIEALTQAVAALVAIDFNQIITITDKYLKMNIQQALGITGEITLGNMYTLTSLNSPTARITSLEGLQYAKNLVTLDISGNEITDFSFLKDLKKLTSIIANPQIVSVNSLKGPVVAVENLVKGLDGEYLNPYQIGLKNTITNKEIYVDVEMLAPNADQFTIDLSEEEKGLYMLVLAYTLNEDTMIQLTYYVDNQ